MADLVPLISFQGIALITQIVNPSAVETTSFRDIWPNAVFAGALAHCVARS